MSDEPRVDLSELGTLAANAMQSLEEQVAEEVADGFEVPTVKTVGIVVELDFPPSEVNDGAGSTAIRYRCSDKRVWIQRALFREASDLADRGREPAG